MKKPFFDTTFGFALKLFGIIFLVNFLMLILSYVLTIADDLIGSFITSFIINGVGLLSIITSIYTTAWQKGFRDLGLVSRDVTVYKSVTGLYAGIIAIIPSAAVYLFLVISYFSDGAAFNIARGIFMILHTYGFSLVSMLIGTGAAGVILSAVFFAPLPFIAWLGYYMGYKNQLITKLIMYGKDKPQNTDK